MSGKTRKYHHISPCCCATFPCLFHEIQSSSLKQVETSILGGCVSSYGAPFESIVGVFYPVLPGEIRFSLGRDVRVQYNSDVEWWNPELDFLDIRISKSGRIPLFVVVVLGQEIARDSAD